MATWQTHNWITQDGTHNAFRKVAFTDDGVVFHQQLPDYRALEVPRKARSEPRADTFRWMGDDGAQREQDYTEGAEEIKLTSAVRVLPPPE